MATAFDSLIKFGTAAEAGGGISSLEDLRNALGWSETALKRRRREAGIAVHLRSRTADYVDGLLAVGAFRDSCREEALAIAGGGSYGASFLLAIGPALMAEADAFLGFRASVLGSWRGPVNGLRRTWLSARRKLAVGGAVVRAAKAGASAVYRSGEFTTVYDHDRGQERRTFEPDADLLRDNLQDAIPTVLEMAWAMNYADISSALHGACDRLFHDAAVASWDERLRRAEAVSILGGQFYLVGIEAAGGSDAWPGAADGDVDDIKARASAAFQESVRSGGEGGKSRDGWSSDEM